MRILFWMGTFWPAIGGVTVQAARFLPALLEHGHEIVVVAFASKDSVEVPCKVEHQSIPVYRIPLWKSHNDLEQLITIRQEISQIVHSFVPDVIHKNGVGIGDFFLHSTSLPPSVPTLVALHQDWPSGSDTLAQQTLRSADWVVGVSETLLERGRQLAPEIIPRSSVIHNAVTEPIIQPEALPVLTPRLLCIGRLVSEKGFDIALRAAASIIGRFPGLRLIITGDGPERVNLQRQATDLGIEKAVEFTGWISPDAVPALLNTATAVLMPSRCQEAFGLIALEAALMSRPVVASRIGGIPEIVLHNQTGLLVEAGNSTALAEAISHLLDQPEIAVRMGQFARILALKRFSFMRYLEAYETLYRRVVADRRKNTHSHL